MLFFNSTSILRSNEKLQKDVFINLGEKGLPKLVKGLQESNVEVRKSSAKLLCEVLYNNEVLQNIFCEKYGFNPIGNIICLNWMPKVLKEKVQINDSLINEIKNSYYPNLCRYWMWPYNSKYNENNTPDPMKYLIGFYYANKNNNLNNVVLEDKYKTNLNNLTSQLETHGTLSEKAAGSGSESATKLDKKQMEIHHNREITMDYEDEKPMMTEPIQAKNMYSKGSTRTKSPYVAQGSINKNSRVVEQKIANSPDKIGQLKAMVNNNPTSSTSKPKSNITANIPSNIVDKLKSNDKNPILNSKIEEYKKQKKNGYSRSIDTNIPLNTLTNITLTTKGDTTKKLSSNTKAPMVKYK